MCLFLVNSGQFGILAQKSPTEIHNGQLYELHKQITSLTDRSKTLLENSNSVKKRLSSTEVAIESVKKQIDKFKFPESESTFEEPFEMPDLTPPPNAKLKTK